MGELCMRKHLWKSESEPQFPLSAIESKRKVSAVAESESGVGMAFHEVQKENESMHQISGCTEIKRPGFLLNWLIMEWQAALGELIMEKER